jgi:hypothetical protein
MIIIVLFLHHGKEAKYYHKKVGEVPREVFK